MAITSAISSLGNSISELISSILGAMYTILDAMFNAIYSLGQTSFAFACSAARGVLNVANSLAHFLMGNAFVLLVGVAAAFVFVRYTAQGQRAVGAVQKKTQ